MTLTDIQDPAYFHKVVDCQWACPAHTPVPRYIRLVAEGRYDDAYMVNWRANVFPGILGRTCDRPCEPACRRGRVEAEPVAVCRLKRAAADFKDDLSTRMPEPAPPTGRRIALVGAGPASLTVTRDLSLLGHTCVLFDGDPKAGGMMRTRIPRFRVPEHVIDEEVERVLALGAEFRPGMRIASLKALLAEGWDAVFVGAGAPRGQDLDLPGRAEAAPFIHVGVEWLAHIWFRHVDAVERRVVVIGGGNTAMDCARSARRLGGADVKVLVRGPRAEMRAAPWEREDVEREGVAILDLRVPKAFTHADGRLTGVLFERVEAVHENGRRTLVPTGAPDEHVPCDEVIIAIGQEPAFPWIERDLGIAFTDRGLPEIDPATLRSGHPRVFFGGDAALGPKNIITAVAQGHEAAISIDAVLAGRDPAVRPAPEVGLAPAPPPTGLPHPTPRVSRAARAEVPRRTMAEALAALETEVELGFDPQEAAAQAGRCLNCDAETVFAPPLCVECNSCVTHCPTDCITFTGDSPEDELRRRLRAPALNLAQAIYVADGLVSGRVMAKSEDLCLHCGLCAEHCPTGAWRIEGFSFDIPLAGGARPAALSEVAAHG